MGNRYPMFTAAILAFGLAFGPASPTDAEAKPRQKVIDQRPFGPASIWASPLQPGAPLSPMSAQYVDRLEAAVASHGAWINTTEWSTPVYTVGPNRPRVSVTLPAGVRPEVQAAFEQVPMPRRGRPSPDNDAHMVIWQPSSDTMWEMWETRRTASGWSASYGGSMPGVSEAPGYFTFGGATATGLPLLGGLIRIKELQAGHIPHALSMAIPEPRAGWYAWPAQRTDGTSHHPFAIPEGTRFRLDPALDVEQLSAPRAVKTIARAAQRYGIYVIDRGDAVAFEAEQPRAPRNPYSDLFGGASPSALLAQFPWNRLEAVDGALHCC